MTQVIEMKPEPKIKNAGTINWLQQCIHRSRNEIFSEVKTVTPGLAEVILTANPDNRRLRETKITQLVSDMQNDRWAFNGEPIIIAKNGELNDGQHRLIALVQAKVSLPMLFVFGVERETRITLDQGTGRSAGDYLSMKGTNNANTVSAVARYLISYEKNKGEKMGRAKDITPAQILERVERDITIETSARYGNTHSRRMRGKASGSVIGFCHNVLLGINSTDGLAFMEALCLGENIRRGDPAFTARERLDNLDRGGYVSQIEIIFRAWNAYREGREMRVIPVHGRLPELV